ncbi:response regulator transcription factor [Pinisolibacter sp.]|uniref:response regulator transcription factor n=1 Tax=Pinisolibacter sp. TaxID=2172024 RepID=UPI002FDCB3BF
MALRALIIEDDAVMAGHVADLLAGRDFTTETTADGADGLRRAAASPFDLIVTDRMLPGLEGLDVIDRLRALGVTTPIMVVSALGLSGDRVHGLERGADDYLAKPFSDDEFLARVHALLRRARIEPHPEVLLVGDIEIRVKARTVHRAGRHVALSPKEFELLRCLAEHAGRYVPRSLLLERVWKLRFDPQTNVVDVHVSRLRGKIDDGFDGTVIRSARGEGYMLAADAP